MLCLIKIEIPNLQSVMHLFHISIFFLGNIVKL